MIHGIYKPVEKKNEWYIDLLDEGGDRVDVVLRDENGKLEARLFYFLKSTGAIGRYKNIDKKYGFDLDSEGRLKIE